jgi:hypothetical protein
MGLFGGSSKSRSNQTTTANAANSQGSQAPLSGLSGSKATYTEGGGYSNFLTTGISGRANQVKTTIAHAEQGGLSVGHGVIKIENANSTEIAEIMANVSLSAIDSIKDATDYVAGMTAEALAFADDATNKAISFADNSAVSEGFKVNKEIINYAFAAGVLFVAFKVFK